MDKGLQWFLKDSTHCLSWGERKVNLSYIHTYKHRHVHLLHWPLPPQVQSATCWEQSGLKGRPAAGQPPPEKWPEQLSNHTYCWVFILQVCLIQTCLLMNKTDWSLIRDICHTGLLLLCGCVWTGLITSNLSLCLFRSNVENRLDSRPRMWTVGILLAGLGCIKGVKEEKYREKQTVLSAL